MNIQEYETIKNYTYQEYCDYLQSKYGIGLADYMTKSFNINQKVKRTKEGLLAHHKMEDTMIMLSKKEIAEICPFEWQTAENIVYCDYLEHLLLHILICEYPSPNVPNGIDVGIGGVINFLVPELNDLFSGWETKQEWRKSCHNLVKNDKDVYLTLIKRFVEIEKLDNKTIRAIKTSSNPSNWSASNNADLYKEFDSFLSKPKKHSLFKLFE